MNSLRLWIRVLAGSAFCAAPRSAPMAAAAAASSCASCCIALAIASAGEADWRGVVSRIDRRIISQPVSSIGLPGSNRQSWPACTS